MPPARDSLRACLSVAATEVRASFRDRQALLYTVVLPLALYPVIFWVMLQGWLLMDGYQSRTEVEVGVAAAAAGTNEDARLVALERDLDVDHPGPVRTRNLDAAEVAGRDVEEVARDLVRGGELEAVLAPGALEAGGARLWFDGTKSRSALARTRVEERLAVLAEELREDALGQPPVTLEPFVLEYVDHAETADLSAYALSYVLPMMFVIMAVMGCFFPAVDTTAGEKERGTAETTLLLPVPRTAVQVGKVLAVGLGGLLATVLNLTGMLLAAEHLLSGFGEEFAIVVPWSGLLTAAPLLLLFLLTTSALLVSAASLTETFKQGQALVGALQMVFILPGVVVAMPGIDLSPASRSSPSSQTVLAFQAILQGAEGVALELVLVAVSQTVYAALAVVLTLRLGTRESLLLGATTFGRAWSVLRAGGAPR